MNMLYQLGIFFLGAGMKMASLFHPKAKKWVDGRKNLLNQLPSTEDAKIAWFHCASLGEFDQGIPVIKAFRQKFPEHKILLTFYSPSGMDFYQKREAVADFVCYIPLDTKKNAKRFIQHFHPEYAFFIKYEFWLNHIKEATQNGAKIYNVSGVFRKEQRFFKPYGTIFRKALSSFTHFFVQNESSKNLLYQIGIKNVTITGDTRFDRVLENKKNTSVNESIIRFKGERPLLIAGSSWEAEENILAQWNTDDFKLLIAPHDISEGHIKKIQNLFPKAIRYTRVSSSTDLSSYKVMILDTMGQLACAYLHGDIAFVGGGFSGNLHNILEPAVFGLPVLFGPKHQRFPEAETFIQKGFGFAIKNINDFTKSIQFISNNYDNISEKEQSFVKQNAGASEKIIRLVN